VWLIEARINILETSSKLKVVYECTRLIWDCNPWHGKRCSTNACNTLFPPLAKCNHKHLHKIKIATAWEITNCHFIMKHIWRHISFNCKKFSISRRNLCWWHLHKSKHMKRNLPLIVMVHLWKKSTNLFPKLFS
jgi:hypothetical protein